MQELLAVLGIAVGVALLFASQVANNSLAGSVTHLTDGLVGKARLQLAARDPSGFSEGLLSEIERLPGVSAAAPVLQRSVYVRGPAGEESVNLFGLSVRFSSLEGRLLSRVSATQLPRQLGLAITAPVARKIGAGPLESLRIEVGDRSTKTLAAVILQRSDIGELIDDPVAVAPLGLAQRLTGMQGSINRILVEPRPGHDREVRDALLRIAVGRLNVLPANFEARIFAQAESPTAQSTQMFSVISALVGFLFAFNAMLLTVPQRRNLIGDLRLDGYTTLEIVEVMLCDVLALGVVGVLGGLALGDLLSRGLLQAEPGYLTLAFPVGSLHVVNWQSVVIAAAGGMSAAVVGVMIPLRDEIFGNHSIGSRVAGAPNRKRRMVVLNCGLGCTALTTVILIQGMASVEMAILAFTSLTLALLFIMPTAFSGAVWLIERVQRPARGIAPRIALIELMSSTTRSRSLAIAATGAIAVFGSVAIEGAQGNLRAGLDHAAADLSRGTNLWVSPSGGATTLATTPFEDSYRRALERLPSVRGVGLYRGGFLDLGDRRVLVIAPPKTDNRLLPEDQVIRGDPTQAMWRLHSSGWLAVSQALA
ncbi:MAG TPA: ABC transporter permease, partial [Solirubrobacteraceae bacterium]|nr:ABC transporter permease [Solirubrobacteraceae bacterium]